MPISFVLSVTDTSIIFIMPIPPTSSDTPAIDPNKSDIVLTADCIVSIICVKFLTWKSSSCFFPILCLNFKSSVTSCSAAFIELESFAFMFIILTVPGKFVPKTFFCPVVIGIMTKSSWSCPIEFCPLDSSKPITLNGTPPILTVRPIGSRSPKSSFATVFPIIATFDILDISSSIKLRPRLIFQSLIAIYSGVVPAILVDQF